MIILAFDQASRTSGFSVFKDGELVDHGTFTFTDSNLGMRLWKIRRKVEDLIHVYKPDKIIYEDIQLQQGPVNNVDTFKILSEVFGIFFELATERGIPNEAYLSSVWRKGLGIAGRKRDEQKSNAQKWVLDNCGVRVVEDEADAICIGAFAAGIRSQKQKSTIVPDFDWS